MPPPYYLLVNKLQMARSLWFHIYHFIHIKVIQEQANCPMVVPFEQVQVSRPLNMKDCASLLNKMLSEKDMEGGKSGVALFQWRYETGIINYLSPFLQAFRRLLLNA